MLTWFRSLFCDHQFTRNRTDTPVTRVKKTFDWSYPYPFYQETIWCSKCGKVKKLN